MTRSVIGAPAPRREGELDGVRAPAAALVHVSVANPMLAEALRATAERLGWALRANRDAGAVLVTDRVPVHAVPVAPGSGVVLVCEPTPCAARAAVDAVADLVVSSIVCADRPDDLQAALDGLAHARASLPVRVLTLASRMPRLNDRQRSLLAGVLSGQTNAEMARGLNLSPASVKRELGRMYSRLGVTSRAGLSARALDLGVRPERLRP